MTVLQASVLDGPQNYYTWPSQKFPRLLRNLPFPSWPSIVGKDIVPSWTLRILLDLLLYHLYSFPFSWFPFALFKTQSYFILRPCPLTACNPHSHTCFLLHILCTTIWKDGFMLNQDRLLFLFSQWSKSQSLDTESMKSCLSSLGFCLSVLVLLRSSQMPLFPLLRPRYS